MFVYKNYVINVKLVNIILLSFRVNNKTKVDTKLDIGFSFCYGKSFTIHQQNFLLFLIKTVIIIKKKVYKNIFNKITREC